MAIVVETGAGLLSATSYVSVASADAYWMAEADTAWSALTTAAKEKALVAASRGIDHRFGGRFVGRRSHRDQAFEWPRDDALDGDDYDIAGRVPLAVARATIELARRIAIDGWSPRATPDAAVRRRRVAAGPVVTETEYAAAQRPAVNDWAPIADILRPVLADRGAASRDLERA